MKQNVQKISTGDRTYEKKNPVKTNFLKTKSLKKKLKKHDDE